MYQAIHYERRKNKIHIWDDKSGHLVVPYKKYAYIKNSSGQHFTLDGDKVKKIYKWEEGTPGLFESDVPITTRFLVDQYTDSDDVSVGHRKLFFDIEVEVTDGFPSVAKADNTITSIALYDDLLHKYYCFTLDVGNQIENYTKDDEVVEFYKTEHELLTRFYQKYSEINPTILSGWNLEFFDIPYLYNRTVKVLGLDVADMLSPIRDVYYNEYKKKHNIAGVNVLDYLKLYRKFSPIQQSSYRLDYIGEVEVGMKKVSYEGTLNDLYEKDLQKFVNYNIRDVRILLELDKKLDYIDIARGIAHIGHVPYEDVFMSSRYLEGSILVYLKKMGIVAPNKPPRPKKFSDDKFAGAYVQQPQSGKHDWVYDLDITSMYPSVIRSLNISPETKIGKVKGWDAEEFLKDNNKKTYSVTNRNGKKMGNLTETELKDYFDKTNVSIGSNGVMYRTDKQGLIPALLTKWFNDRVEMRKLVRNFNDEGDKDKE